MSGRPGMHDVRACRPRFAPDGVAVLNDHPHVRPATRDRVQRAIVELGYRRNVAARSLVTRRSGVLGLLTPRTGLYGPTSSAMAVEVAAREAGYFVSLASVADTSVEALSAAVEHFKDQAAEAVVLIAPELQWLAAANVVAADMPVITMCADFRPARPTIASVAMDNRGRRAARHAAPARAGSPGHRVRRGQSRLAGGGGASAARGAASWAASGSPRRARTPATGAPRAATRPGRQLVADGVPTAVFAANDQMSLGLLRALAEAGYDVPGDVSVAGFDDVSDSAYFTPALTTVHQDFSALAARCVDVLEQMLKGEQPRSVRIRPALIVRDSTAPPREQPEGCAPKSL